MSTTPSIAEKLHVGLYCKDCACQTERDEIIQLKNTTKLLKNVHHEIELLKNELTFTRDSLRSSFHDELQSNGKIIYYQLTDKLDLLRKNHSRALETLRLSYRSQLHDFISQARSIINTEKTTPSESIAQKQRTANENHEKSFFQQAAIKGYETEISNLKKEIELIHETSQNEIKLATTFLNDEKRRLTKELSIANQTINHYEDSLTRKDEQIRDLRSDVDTLESRLKETKKVVVREPTPPPPIMTHSDSTQTDPSTPPSPPPPPPPPPLTTKPEPPRKEPQVMKQPSVVTIEADLPTKPNTEILEMKYQIIIEQKNAQIHQLTQELNIQAKLVKHNKIEKPTVTDDRLRHEMKRNAEKYKNEIQMWETKYDILNKSLMALREEMYTRQIRVRDRFMGKTGVPT